MIKSCQKCGGLYASEPDEAFGGNPCRCPAPTPIPQATIIAPLPDTYFKDSHDEAQVLAKAICKLCGLDSYEDWSYWKDLIPPLEKLAAERDGLRSANLELNLKLGLAAGALAGCLHNQIDDGLRKRIENVLGELP